jgi:tetratricopeptide (TPR) repeat protein
MKKENILFAIVGLLIGLIIGFMGANSINRQAFSTQAAASPTGPANVSDGQSGLMANVPEVQAAIEKAKNEPDNFDSQMDAAKLYIQIERYEGALEFLTRANKIKPDDYQVIVQLGNTNFDADKYEDAEKWYTAALAKQPNDVNVRTDLGLSFMLRAPADYDRAIKEFKSSLEKQPNHPQTLQNLTVAYTKKGDATNATTTLAKLQAMEPSNPAIAKLREDIGKATAR